MTDTTMPGTDAGTEGMKAALATMQEQMAQRDTEIAAKDEQLRLADEAINAAKERAEAAEQLAKALEEKRVAAEIRAEAVSKAANFSQASSKERHLIKIDEGHDKSDPKEVFVGVNGRAYTIKRGIEVEVPYDVISVLNDAVIGRAEAQVDERTGIEAGVNFVQARRFPFQYIRKTVNADGTRVAA